MVECLLVLFQTYPSVNEIETKFFFNTCLTFLFPKQSLIICFITMKYTFKTYTYCILTEFIWDTYIKF